MGEDHINLVQDKGSNAKANDQDDMHNNDMQSVGNEATEETALNNADNAALIEDINDNNVKSIKNSPSVTFTAPKYIEVIKDSRDDHFSSHGLLASPTASRSAFAFGSIDIIMDTEKDGRDNAAMIAKPQRWGWVVVVASWIVMIPIAGVLSSFGNIVSSLTQEFNATKLEAGWIGSLAFSFTVGTCPLSTPLFTVYGARKVAFVGVIGATISLVVTSFTPVLHLMFLTYSAMLGVFANFVYNTSMNLTGQYFPNTHQALATCLASAGISFGTLLVNPLAAALVEAYGWRYSLRILAGGVFVIGLACVATFRPAKTEEERLQSKMRRALDKNENKNGMSEAFIQSPENADVEASANPTQHLQTQSPVHTESRISLAAQEIKKSVFNKNVFDCSVCSNPIFVLWMLGTLFWSISFLFPFIFLIDYMGTLDISLKVAGWVLTAYGISEFIGRLICAMGAGKIRLSLAYIYGISAGVVGIATLLTPFGRSLGIMYAYAIVAGIAAGILNSLMYVTTMQLFGNEKGTHVWGYINVMLALGMVVGPVAAGAIYDATQSYESAFYMGGSVFIVSAFIMLLIPFAKSRFVETEPEAIAIRQKQPKVSQGAKFNGKNQGNGSSIVKPGAIRKFAQHQAALKAANRRSSKSKWNDDVHSHLQALDAIDNEVKQNEFVSIPEIVVKAPSHDSDINRTGV